MKTLKLMNKITQWRLNQEIKNKPLTDERRKELIPALQYAIKNKVSPEELKQKYEITEFEAYYIYKTLETHKALLKRYYVSIIDIENTILSVGIPSIRAQKLINLLITTIKHAPASYNIGLCITFKLLESKYKIPEYEIKYLKLVMHIEGNRKFSTGYWWGMDNRPVRVAYCNYLKEVIKDFSFGRISYIEDE